MPDGKTRREQLQDQDESWDSQFAGMQDEVKEHAALVALAHNDWFRVSERSPTCQGLKLFELSLMVFDCFGWGQGGTLLTVVRQSHK